MSKSKSPKRTRKSPKSLKKTSLEIFLKNKIGQRLSSKEIVLLYNNFGFVNEIYHLTDTSGYVIDGGKLHTWEVKYEFYNNNQVKSEKWYKDGKLHRINNPALKEWYENDQIEREIWYKDGKRHREDGPAFTTWNSIGQVFRKKWYHNGIEFNLTG